MRLLEQLRQLKKRFSNYQPLVTVVIFKDRLLHNLHEFQKANPKVKIAPVIKSNAYGHGLVNVAKIFDKEDIAFFVVDSPFEAKQLRDAGIRSKILVIGYTTAHNIKHSRSKNVSFTITSLDQLKEMGKIIKKPVKIHLKIDTGMHRQGIQMTDLAATIELLKKNSQFLVEGICSHFGDAIGHPKQTEKQIKIWHNALDQIQRVFPNITYRHLASTLGTTLDTDINANIARVGIGLYGFNLANSPKIDLKPTLEMRTVLTSLRKIPAGESIGYDFTFTAPSELTMATLPVGYFEGVERQLSNKGSVLIRGYFCPIVGRVSMNITSVDVTQVPNVALNDEVLVISSNTTDPNSVEQLAHVAQTIPYTILVHIPAHLRRIVR